MEPLTVPGTLEALGAISQYVTAAATTAGLDKKTAYRLRLAVDEIATNIITHGYAESGQTGEVTVLAEVTSQALRIILEDTSPPFDPRRLGRPEQLDQPADTRPVGGLGVFLTLRNVDWFEYEYANSRNRNIFVMQRAASL